MATKICKRCKNTPERHSLATCPDPEWVALAAPVRDRSAAFSPPEDKRIPGPREAPKESPDES